MSSYVDTLLDAYYIDDLPDGYSGGNEYDVSRDELVNCTDALLGYLNSGKHVNNAYFGAYDDSDDDDNYVVIGRGSAFETSEDYQNEDEGVVPDGKLPVEAPPEGLEDAISEQNLDDETVNKGTEDDEETPDTPVEEPENPDFALPVDDQENPDYEDLTRAPIAAKKEEDQEVFEADETAGDVAGGNDVDVWSLMKPKKPRRKRGGVRQLKKTDDVVEETEAVIVDEEPEPVDEEPVVDVVDETAFDKLAEGGYTDDDIADALMSGGLPEEVTVTVTETTTSDKEEAEAEADDAEDSDLYETDLLYEERKKKHDTLDNNTIMSQETGKKDNVAVFDYLHDK